MDKDINKTLAALVPILQMNGMRVKKIEAVRAWYKECDEYEGDRVREFSKEVAEITFGHNAVIYADIGEDSNLTACYDVLGVIQQLKPRSSKIQRIERGIYEPAGGESEIETKCGEKPGFRCEICGHLDCEANPEGKE